MNELLWLQKILENLKIEWERHMRLYCDNKLTISIADNLVQHKKTKHIKVNRHFIKEKLDSGVISKAISTIGWFSSSTC